MSNETILTDQLKELQSKVVELEGALERKAQDMCEFAEWIDSSMYTRNPTGHWIGYFICTTPQLIDLFYAEKAAKG